jgi:hypothetical protein
MQTYKEFRPTEFDSHIGVEDREDWLVVPCGRNRDSDCLTESNFATALDMLGGESETVECLRFGHWACGWFEVLIADPSDAKAMQVCAKIEKKLKSYPVLNEGDFCEREQIAADETWKLCYNNADRIEYMRKYRSQFEFSSFSDMLGCARGKFFSGYASELIG